MNKKEIRCAQQCYDFPVVVKVLLLYVAANVFLKLHSHCRVKTLLNASGNAKTPLCTANNKRHIYTQLHFRCKFCFRMAKVKISVNLIIFEELRCKSL